MEIPISDLADIKATEWYRGLSLAERAQWLRGRSSANYINGSKFERWSQEGIFKDEPDLFQERITQAQLSPEEFRAILNTPVEDLSLPSLPEWLTHLLHAFEAAPLSEPLQFFAMEANADPSQQQMLGFLNLVEPIVRQSRHRLHERIEALQQKDETSPIQIETIDHLLIEGLLRYLLYSNLIRTLVLELNVARLRGLLAAGTPEQRFQNFIAMLKDRDYALQLFSEYPVLARQIITAVHQWEAVSFEFVSHLTQDWAAIHKTFSPTTNPGKLTTLQTGAGDKHRNGHSVFILEFSSGLRLVYKPRSLAVDAHFQELLVWLNQHGDHPPFRTLKVLDYGDHGWIEFVEAAPCGSVEELERFYERQGAYLALLFALKATDFHFENLIASGEHPILIDLESLFHPPVDGVNLRESELEQSMGRAMQHSVLSVGLLPQRLWGNEEHAGVDLSGLGGKAGQISPHKIPTYEQIGTDSMHLTRKHMEMPGGNNRPTLNGSDIKVHHYTEAIVKGFTTIYRLLIHHRDQILAPEGPLNRFANDEVRIIVRPTRIYGILLHEASHPDLLRDGLDRDRFFDGLWTNTKDRPFLKSLIAAEQQELWTGDIPMFSTQPASRDLWASNGEHFERFFDQSGMALAREQLESLNEPNLNQQLWFIRASLATLTMEVGHAHWPIYQPQRSSTMADKNSLLEAARRIGDRLKMLALQSKDGAAWIGLSLVHEKHWTLMPLGLDLYNGLPGVVLFLAHLGHNTADPEYTELARDGLTTIQRTAKLMDRAIKSTGAFDGWASLIYVYLHLGVLWKDDSLLDQAEELAQYIPDLIEQDRQLDIIGGAAGAIGVLLALYDHRPSEVILNIARQYGEFLLQQAKSMPKGAGWVTTMSDTPLAGFSHGVSGMAWALFKLASTTGDHRFHELATKAISYERTLYSPTRNNWPDLRDYDFSDYIDDEETLEALKNASPDGQKYMVAWCHGAPGVGISRVGILPYLEDTEIHEEINHAVRATMDSGFGLNHSLCHGDLGNLEFLLLTSERERPDLQEFVYRQAHSLLTSFETQGWLCGVPAGIETPGLMTGLAGIGYAMLRLALPSQIPSVLLLAPPKH